VNFAVFLDRDGTIVADKHFLADPDGLELLPNAAEGLRELSRLGARLVVVTNQSGVGRGYFPDSALEPMNERLRELLAAARVELDAIYACPHAPEEGCSCRKPESALFLRAAEELDLELGRSFVLGDREVDVEAGRRIGATSILIGSEPPDRNWHNARDLLAAARLVEKLRA
jgi:D-glycero-D-manno-heptose 1,7-bisphosphate phosphatase